MNKFIEVQAYDKNYLINLASISYVGYTENGLATIRVDGSEWVLNESYEKFKKRLADAVILKDI